MISPFFSSQWVTALVNRCNGSPLDQSTFATGAAAGPAGAAGPGAGGTVRATFGGGVATASGGAEAGRPRFWADFGGRPGPGGGAGGALKKDVSSVLFSFLQPPRSSAATALIGLVARCQSSPRRRQRWCVAFFILNDRMNNPYIKLMNSYVSINRNTYGLEWYAAIWVSDRLEQPGAGTQSIWRSAVIFPE